MNALRSLFRRQDLLAGLFVLALGAVCLAAVGDLDIGNAQEMGPGYVPRALAWFLVVAGAGMTAVAAWQVRPTRPSAAVQMAWRPVLGIAAAVLAFGVTVDRLGIVTAVVLSTVIASLASPISRARETPLLAIALAALAGIAFVRGLGLAIPLWPR